ncbi:MAG: cytochrome c oxidase subunit II [Xanthomonadales bacterium]|nr:cytochrome c oxidase subunit II [Xanthomonadales bacterium]|tara:strand:- start:6 stop:1193 length:1188 start_codon:yes stop_codon:yes gene_type:complete
MKRTNEMIVGLAMVAVITVITWGVFAVGDNMTAGVTPFSRDVYQLHMIVLGIVTVIGILVFAAMFTSIYLHRKSRGAEAAKFTHSTRAEIIWTVIPILILVAMAIPATRVLIDMEDTSGAEMNIKVTGYQWLWQYEYLEDGISFYSALDRDSNAARQIGSDISPREVDNYLLEVDKRMVVPTNTRIRVLLTSGDVIHSWWVPDLGWKRDAIPGMVNEAWTLIEEPGVYRGQCAELCGKDHGFMPVVVEAVSPEDYRAWVAEQTGGQQTAEVGQPLDEMDRDTLMAHGEDIYDAHCAACHREDGSGMQPAFPALAGNAVVTGDVSQHIDVVVNGRPGTAMAAFGQRLEARDIAAALTYTRNAFGNETGDLVQPADVVPLIDAQLDERLVSADRAAN